MFLDLICKQITLGSFFVPELAYTWHALALVTASVKALLCLFEDVSPGNLEGSVKQTGSMPQLKIPSSLYEQYRAHFLFRGLAFY